MTTQAVLTEVADGMASSRDRAVFVQFYDELRASPDVKIVESSTELFTAALDLYRSRLDKEWSLTDCISFIVMKRESLREALTEDHHFGQAGFVPTLQQDSRSH